jgi:predicted RNA-binding Zn-ribbon protein involved in translation (DUF1610 family)
MNDQRPTPYKVVCPDCGDQEPRGRISNVYEFPPAEGVSRHVNPADLTCPKCGSETVPIADHPLKKQMSNSRDVERKMAYIAMQRGRKHYHIIAE